MAGNEDCVVLRSSSPQKTLLLPVKVEGEKVKPAVKGEEWVPWDESDFKKPKQYWSEVCRLPAHGLNPGAIPESLVTKDMLKACFGDFTNNGSYLSACSGIPHEDIVHLTQILDGHEKSPLNGMLGVSLARGLYADFVLGKPVNWASFAELKHKNQLKKAIRDKKPKPDGPPFLRVDRVYSPRPSSDKKPPSTAPDIGDAGAPLPTLPTLPTAVEKPEVNSATADCAIVPHPSLFVSDQVEKYQPDPTPFVNALLSALDTEIGHLRVELASVGARVGVLEAQVDADIKQTEQTEERIDLLQKCLPIEKDKQEKAEKQLEDALELKQNAALELEEWKEDLDDEDLNAMEAIEKLEAEDNRLAEQVVLSQLQVDTTRTGCANIHEQLQALHAKFHELKAHNDKRVEEFKKLRTSRTEFRTMLESVEAEKDAIAKHFEGEYTVLKPRYIPTSITLRHHLFKMSRCAICLLGYHCNNFVPTPCGHCYHPACLVPLLSVSEGGNPRCVVCQQVFHPDWLQSWGLNHSSTELADLECKLGLESQRRRFQDQLQDLYREGAPTLKQRLQKEIKKQLALTITYSKLEGEAQAAMGDIKRKAETIELSQKSAIINIEDSLPKKGSGRKRNSVGSSQSKADVKGLHECGGESTEGTPAKPTPAKPTSGRKKQRVQPAAGDLPPRKVTTRGDALSHSERASMDASPAHDDTMTVMALSDVVSPPSGKKGAKAARNLKMT